MLYALSSHTAVKKVSSMQRLSKLHCNYMMSCSYAYICGKELYTSAKFDLSSHTMLRPRNMLDFPFRSFRGNPLVPSILVLKA